MDMEFISTESKSNTVKNKQTKTIRAIQVRKRQTKKSQTLPQNRSHIPKWFYNSKGQEHQNLHFYFCKSNSQEKKRNRYFSKSIL